MIQYPYFLATSLLSVIGCILNILFTVFLKKMHNCPLGKMIIHLSIFDLLYVVGFEILQELNVQPKIDNYLYYCLLFLISFGNTGSLVMANCFAHCLYRIGEEGNDNFLQLKYKLYTKIYYGIALIRGIIAFAIAFLHLYLDDKTLIFGLLLTKDLLWILEITISLIVSLKYYIRGFKLVYQRRISIPWVLLIYPTILFVCNIPLYLYSLLQNWNVIEKKLIFSLMDQFIFSLWLLQGFFNALVYGLTRGVREAIKEQCCKNDADDTLSIDQTEVMYHQYTTDNKEFSLDNKE